MVPPLPAASRPSKIDGDAQPGVLDPLLQLDELDLELLELGLVHLAVELLVVAGLLRRRRAHVRSGPVFSGASAFFLSFGLSAIELPPGAGLAVRHIIVQADPRGSMPALPARTARTCSILSASEQRGVETPVELPDRPLEAELAEIAEHAEPGRTARLAVRHWGWDGRGGATLEATGREFGITRERVRQLCDRLAQRLAAAARPAAPRRPRRPGSTASPPRPSTGRSSSPLTPPPRAHDLARRLADAHIAAQPFDPSTSSRPPPCSRAPRPSPSKTSRSVRCPARPRTGRRHRSRHRHHHGNLAHRREKGRRCSDRRSHGPRGRRLAVWVDDAFVTAVVSESADFVWLERRTGWFLCRPYTGTPSSPHRQDPRRRRGRAPRRPARGHPPRRRMRDSGDARVRPRRELYAHPPGVRLSGDLVVADAADPGRRPRDDES